MNTTMQDKLTEAGIKTSTFAYFDLIDFVDNNLLDGELKGRVMASLAWNLDNRAIYLARSVFFETYRESLETGTIDAFNEFANAMAEQLATGKLTPVGFEDASSFTQLTLVLNMRKHWHDNAQRCSTREYNPKSLAAMVADEKPRQVDVNTRSKLAVRAKFVAGDDEALQKTMLDKLIEKSNATLQQQHELRQKMVKPVLHILQIAGHKAEFVYDGECPPFSELPMAVQINLIEQCMAAADRAVDDMGISSRVSIDDYAVAMRDAAELKKQLREVLKAPRFNNPNNG